MLVNESQDAFGPTYAKIGTAVALFLLPLILLVGYDSLFITPIETIDPWLYLGYKLDLVDHLEAFAGTYYGTRLPALIPGSVFYSLFPPLTANYFDHLLFYCISIAALYLIVRSIAGPRGALVTSILLGFYCYFLMAVGWDYVDGVGVSYLLVTLALLTHATTSLRPRVLLLLAGMSFGLAVFTNLFLVIFVLVFIPFYSLANRRHGIKKVLVGMFFIVIGIAVTTLSLCLVNYALVGNFFFFEPSIRFASRYINQVNHWRAQGAGWLLNAPHLVVPAFVLVGSLISLGRRIVKRREKVTTNRVPIELAYVLAATVFIAWELHGQPCLQFYYYASYLIPFTFPVIGVWSHPFVEKLERRHFGVFVSFLIIVMAVSLSPGIAKGLVDLAGGRILLWSIVLICLALITLFVFRNKAMGIFFSICILGLAHSSLCNFPIAGPRQGLEIRKSDCFLAVVKGVLLAKNADPKCAIRFWYDGSERLGSVYGAISSAFCWGPRLVNESFPEVKDLFNPSRPIQLAPRTRIFIFSEKQKSIDDVNRALQPINLMAQTIKRDSLSQANIRFKVLLVEVDKLGK